MKYLTSLCLLVSLCLFSVGCAPAHRPAPPPSEREDEVPPEPKADAPALELDFESKLKSGSDVKVP